MLGQFDINKLNLDKLKDLKVEDVKKDVFVNFFKSQLCDYNKQNVLGWCSSIKKHIEINKIQTNMNNLLIKNELQLKEITGLSNIKDVNNLNEQKVNELKTNNNLKNFIETEDGKKIIELSNEFQKIYLANYEDNNESEDEKLKFVLEYVYNHLDEENSEYAFGNVTYRTDLSITLQNILEKLNKTKLEKNKSVNPWYVDVLIGLLAITCTGLVWFIFGIAKDKKTREDVDSKVYKPKSEYDNEENRDASIDIIAGVFNVLISTLFVFSLIFAWAVAIQAILGIIFALQAVIGIVQVFKYEKDEFQRRKYNNEINLKNTEINSAKCTAQKIFAWLNQTKLKEEPSKNQETNLNLEYNSPDEQQGTIPAQGTNFSTIIQNEKRSSEPGQGS